MVESIGIAPGFIIWNAIGGVIILAFIVLLVLTILDFFWDAIWAIISGVLAFFTLAFMIFGAVPFESKYWEWYEVSGHVTSVESRTVAENFVITVEGVEFPLLTDDARVLRLEGETVDFVCNRNWVSFGHGADKYTCDISDAGY